MPQICVPVAILLKPITPEIYIKKGVVYGTPWDAPDLRTCCHFAQTNHPRNLHKKRVLFMAPPGMPQIRVPVAILLKTITPEIYITKGVVYGTPWDAPDLRTCCHFAQTNPPRNLHKKRVLFMAPPGMPQICVPIAILLKTITPEIYIKKGVVYGTPWDAPDLRTCCHFAQTNHPRNLHKKRVLFMAPPGMPQICVPIAILLKTITPEIYIKKGVVYGTPWDAPDLRTCCHFAQTNHPRNLHKKRVLFMAPPGMPQIRVPVAILLKTITPEIYITKGVVYGTPWDAPDLRTCCHFAQTNPPRNLHKKKVLFMAPPGMPQICVPVAMLLKTITPEIYIKNGVVDGTPWDAPDQRTCCHFAQNNHPRNLHKKGCRLRHPLGCPRSAYLLPFCSKQSPPKFTQKRVSFTAPLGMPQISVPVAILLKTITPEIYTKKGVVYGTPWDAPDQRTCCHFA